MNNKNSYLLIKTIVLFFFSLNYQLANSKELNKQAHCPEGTELVKGLSARDHCALLESSLWATPGIDHQGIDVCKEQGLGGFKEYTYRLDNNNQTFQKTLICQQEEQPIFSSEGNIISCPSYAELIKGKGLRNHCALNGSTPRYDITNNVDVCTEAGRGKGQKYIYDANGTKSLICKDDIDSLDNIAEIRANSTESTILECPECNEGPSGSGNSGN